MSLQRLQSLPRWLPLAALSGAAVVATVVLRRVDPNVPGNPLPGCPFRALTGLYCPGCGSTRCLHALVHLDLAHAWTSNPLLVVALPLLAIMALNAAGLRLRPLAPLLKILADPRLWLWVLLGYALLRNLPWYPFTLLAPH
ncbi:DUF2752 domain-containing protein [Xanthomonas sacchari]|uniref:DUF2752 domain-containing protein n=1 Tax=Xanthomonas sacchari TaxID=56458 RepID=UPI0022591CCB|nr:DUF2752 domain-containing protein [Xanthomonas sacchari]MCW0374816.1 hypothetical protein [Xanthomonas sacchari]MCW0387049.1 hypothetical protein [Xanthomonas sacchari]